MSESPFLVKFTSYDFEQEVLNRFRLLVAILPVECVIYRETWDSSTVLCLNFENCPCSLEIIKENVEILITIMTRLSIAKSIIFRQGNQLKAWRNFKD
jgi:hypothetical protein